MLLDKFRAGFAFGIEVGKETKNQGGEGITELRLEKNLNQVQKKKKKSPN